MILPFLLALLAFAAMLPIVLPLMNRTRTVPPRTLFDQAVYRDQLRELDRDVARGLLTDDEAQSARLEIQRRLLAAAPDPAAANPAQAERPARPSPVLALMVVLMVGGGSVAMYSLMPGQPPRTPVAGEPDPARQEEMRRLVGQLKERLAKEPNSTEGWRLYARATAGMGEWDEAAAAYQRLMALGDASADTQAAYGEILVAKAQGIVTPEARKAFEAVVARDPANGMARFYLALAAGQGGEPKRAIDLLQALAADLPEGSPERTEIARRIAAFAKNAGIEPPKMASGRPAEPGPDAATAAAAAQLPPAERQAMIRGMVNRLAEKLEKDPSDLDGWLRLGRARAVLGESDKAADAYEKAAALRPDDVSIPLLAVEALLKGHALTEPLPPRAVAILRRIQAGHPDEPAVLWYMGLVAAREGKLAETRDYWQRLLAQLPPDGKDTEMVKAALDALNRK
ncbi:MAG: c-type cytochrome biogenesis protein CcmI [Acetobacteraceae bacterium]